MDAGFHPVIEITPNTAPDAAADRRSCRKTYIRVARPHPDVLPPSLPPLGSIGAVREIFRHRIRAVHSFWRDELDGLAGRPCHSEQRSEKYTLWLAPFLGNHNTFCDRLCPQARPLATPSSRCCKDPSMAWATTQNSTTRRRTELIVDRAPLPVIRAS